MNYLKQYLIPFKGLALGSHEYEWDLDEQFFEAYNDTDKLGGKLHAVLVLERQERMLVMNFTISGNVIVPCDRCMADLKISVHISEPYYIKMGQEWMEESEEVLIIPESEYQINVADLLHDFVVLSFPIKKVHGTDTQGNSLCNKDALHKLDSLNRENKVDPRWEALKNIKFDNNN